MIVQAGLFAPIVAPPPPQDPFYNRVTELDYFKGKFSREAGFVTVLVGPRNCGKSVSSAFLGFVWHARAVTMRCSFLFLLDSFKHSSSLTAAFYLLRTAEIVGGTEENVRGGKDWAFVPEN